MKTQLSLVTGCMLTILLTACDNKATLETEKDRFSYSIGHSVGRNLKGNNLDIDLEIFEQAVEDALTEADPLLSEDEMSRALQAVQQKIQQEQFAKLQQQAEENEKVGEAFLEANKKSQGIVVQSNGLQYKVIKKGKGKKPKASDTVAVHYRGTFISGEEFDSSYIRGEPVTFAINEVIEGWQQALRLMPKGAKWQVFVPPELAYGPAGYGNVVGPNATLIFDIELIEIK